MAFWVEIKCDVRDATAGCWSDRNEGPMGLQGQQRRALSSGLRELERQALAQGWRLAHNVLICPACLAARTRQIVDSSVQK